MNDEKKKKERKIRRERKKKEIKWEGRRERYEQAGEKIKKVIKLKL